MAVVVAAMAAMADAAAERVAGAVRVVGVEKVELAFVRGLVEME